MCGIFGYVGTQPARNILINGLSALEYRGYDSAGLFVPPDHHAKAAGRVSALAAETPHEIDGTAGIAHTRWATHGEPTEANAHPHTDCGERLWLVHNGIIENVHALRSALEQRGHTFTSQTDSEVLVHLIEEQYEKAQSLAEAVSAALQRISGAYGIVVATADEPDTLIAARSSSPLVIGVGHDEYFIASDPSAIVRYTRDVVYLEDGDLAQLSTRGYRITALDFSVRNRTRDTLEWSVEDVQRGGYEHFMMKEIMETPSVIEDTMRGRLVPSDGTAKLGGLDAVADKLAQLERITIVGCGSAYYAGLIGKHYLEAYAGISVDVELGSEFRYRSRPLATREAVLAISQSGETADTLASIREATRRGVLTIGVVNVVGSTIARETDAGVYNHAGPEIGVASTKAFISQVTVLALIAIYLGRQRQLPLADGKRCIASLQQLSTHVSEILARSESIANAARKYTSYHHFLYIGRRFHTAVAYEGALKLKEVSYIHAEGYAAGEMKHGPLAMIDEQFPSVAIALDDAVYEKIRANIEEIRARRGPVVALVNDGDNDVSQLADTVLHVPRAEALAAPIIATVPLQLFAYHAGVARGYNVDKPRNLAKSVTVE
jgi:glucosamine--fructose-6-phosphate aminotransferase (isomerizing)